MRLFGLSATDMAMKMSSIAAPPPALRVLARGDVKETRANGVEGSSLVHSLSYSGCR